MPFYSYQCECGDCVEDHLIKMGQEPKQIITTCKCCDKEKVKFKKIIAPAGFRLKGSGWYKKTSTLD